MNLRIQTALQNCDTLTYRKIINRKSTRPSVKSNRRERKKKSS